jgi:hypothetical protein
MSKMDGLRAMREARYEQQAARETKPIAAPRGRPAPTPAEAPKPAEAESPETNLEDPEARLCGHRAISGRTCTREQGHDAKSHRYS